jgi:hypothetical protein
VARRAARNASTNAATDTAVIVIEAGGTSGPAAKNRSPDGVIRT